MSMTADSPTAPGDFTARIGRIRAARAEGNTQIFVGMDETYALPRRQDPDAPRSPAGQNPRQLLFALGLMVAAIFLVVQLI